MEAEFGRVKTVASSSQLSDLTTLSKLARKGMLKPEVRSLAIAITQSCDARDDLCEVEAIFDWVKSHVRYIADPKSHDYYTEPSRLLKNCQRGACAGDCDDQAVLVAALLGAAGFDAGLRVWCPKSSKYYSHIYPVVALPKSRSYPVEEVLGLDTTVPDSYVGWEPPKSPNTRTAWLTGDFQ